MIDSQRSNIPWLIQIIIVLQERHLTDQSDNRVGHLNIILAQGSSNLNDPNYQKFKCSGFAWWVGGGNVEVSIWWVHCMLKNNSTNSRKSLPGLSTNSILLLEQSYSKVDVAQWWIWGKLEWLNQCKFSFRVLWLTSRLHLDGSGLE